MADQMGSMLRETQGAVEEEEAEAKARGSEQSRSTLETASSQTMQKLISTSFSFLSLCPFLSPLSPSHHIPLKHTG